MPQPKQTRIESIDILRGLVMVLMALDHVRDYFHYGAWMMDPSNLETTTPILFFTRFITHYCASVFIFLAGTSAFLYEQKRGKKATARFLLTRGIWLIVLEVVVMNFLWWFDPSFGFINLQVIWVIGACMILLAGLIYLPLPWLLGFGLLLICGHNALDGVQFEGMEWGEILWYMLHQGNFLPFGEQFALAISYPIVPWIGVMALGYALGWFYRKDALAESRKRFLSWTGLAAIGLFFLIRGLNIYGDPEPWATQDSFTYTVLSFFKLQKYPPSLLYLLITLGPALLVLRGLEGVKGVWKEFLLVFGRVPLFYYILHVLLIHLLAFAGLWLSGQNLDLMILDNELMMSGRLSDYGYPLWTVYLIWVLVVALLYFPCRNYLRYKAANRDKRWLSYL